MKEQMAAYRFTRWTFLGLVLIGMALSFGKRFILLTDDLGLRFVLIVVLAFALGAGLAFIFRIGQTRD